ncbi:hypothetical protein CFAM422_005394 [Trichoderma lentiforme]|uniref:Aminoglycoside phosphotransferase domain-containing protein n=1 Tax=Trichoderma lentiforme TaxID=1567552 RepID=A0A9P4XES8_9HYPO|nr:hypothetical protein CFAM422_005394 [Trichoderma lentiforme]
MEMESLIRNLSQMQIQASFEENAPVTQAQCNAEAVRITGESVHPTAVQGGCSYTVVTEGGSLVVQFRRSDSALDLDFLQDIEQAYKGFVPHHESVGKIGKVHIYRMNNVGGVAMYLARDQLHANGCLLLRKTLQDYARFFSSAWWNTPQTMKDADRGELLQTYDAQLSVLESGLPNRFHQTLNKVKSRLPELFAGDWPMIPNHIDLQENSIHVDTNSGSLVGICDWKETEVSPFGMSLGVLEAMLGIRRVNGGYTYLPNQQALRDVFWAAFKKMMKGYDDRVQVARIVGLFLDNGFQHDEDGNTVPAQEGTDDLIFLDAVILGNSSSQ